ncbi:MAG: hypothetical protein ABW170_21370 [Candidatus Thiodiazotropha sp. L084R]
MLKNLALITLSVFALIIAGCNGGGDDVEVKEFNINGSSSELEDGRVTIDSAINNGEFELVWKVDDDNSNYYTAEFYLSLNSNLDDDNDIRFYTAYCDDLFGGCDDDDRNDEDCWFDNNLEIVCEDDDDPETEVDELIDALPQDLYVIIEACNGSDCDTETVAVRLR